MYCYGVIKLTKISFKLIKLLPWNTLVYYYTTVTEETSTKLNHTKIQSGILGPPSWE